MKMDDKKVEMVVLTTKYGQMTILLYEDTPLHRENFLKLVKEGYYNDLLFHRVIKNFMIQGGDPDSRTAQSGASLGMGGPGYTIPAEFRANHIHKKGALAAARQGDQANPKKESSGSQFYIVHGGPVSESALNNQKVQRSMQNPDWPDYTQEQKDEYINLGGTPHLDGSYTVFGEVISGLNVLDSIAKQPCDRNNRPFDDLKMTAKIEAKKWP
jgi:peptidyl-prolyl cis-trans isomerase B (cyclophilin B)